MASQSSFALPEYTRERLAHSQLTAVMAQIAYPPLPKFVAGTEVDRSYTLSFAERMRHRYPRMTQEHQIKIVLNEQGIQPENGEPILRFVDMDQKWSVLVSKEYLQLESFAYTGFSEFAERLRELASIAKEEFSIDFQLRCGIRFINELRFDECQNYAAFWELLNSEVVGYNPDVLFEGESQALINEVTVKRTDGTLRLRRGFLRGTTVRPIDKRPIGDKPFYLIDLDYFDETPKGFQVDPTNLLATYNHYMFRVFRFLLSDKLYKKLKYGS